MKRMMLVAAVVATTVAPGKPVRLDAGQAPACKMTVVSCNYAHLYGGTFGWQMVLRDADSRTDLSVTVNVIAGAAVCSGSETMYEAASGTTRGVISGAGLIAVEFGPDSANKLSYTITAACPGPAFPGANSGPPTTISQGTHQETYTQPATSIGMTPLKGTWQIPAAETDSINGVTGTLTVTWGLKR